MHGFFKDEPRCFRRALDALDFLFISQNNKAIAVANNAGTFVFECLPMDADEARRHEIARWLQAGAEDFARMHVRSEMPPVLFSHNYLLHNLKQFTDVRRDDVPYLSGLRCLLADAMRRDVIWSCRAGRRPKSSSIRFAASISGEKEFSNERVDEHTRFFRE